MPQTPYTIERSTTDRRYVLIETFAGNAAHTDSRYICMYIQDARRLAPCLVLECVGRVFVRW